MKNGKQIFIQIVIKKIKCTKKQAEKVYGVYSKHKVFKKNLYSCSCPEVKHGAFWEKDVLWNAINLYGKDLQPLSV